MPLLSVSRFGAIADKKSLVNAVSFDIEEGSITGIVGESGSGKSVTCMGLTQLLPKTIAITGQVIYQNLHQISYNLLS